MEIEASVYWNQAREFENGKEKPGENSFSVSLDLAKQRYNLLKLITQVIIKEVDNVSFVYADVNCSHASLRKTLKICC